MMKRILSKILPCLLITLLVITLVGCKEKTEEYKYPSTTPTISNPDQTFIKLGSKEISNKAVYTRLLQTYGSNALVEWLDETLLADKTIDDMDDFNKQMNYIIYGTSDLSELTDEEKDEAKENFEKSMLTQGYDTEEKWTKYYELEYKRLEAGKDNYDGTFTDEDYQTAYEKLYQKDYTVILLTFDSEFEAKKVMKNVGIDTANLAKGWSEDKDTIKNAFVNMYEIMNGNRDAEKTYKFDTEALTNEISKISSTIATKVSALSTMEENLSKSYTRAPLLYGTRYYLALKVSESSDLTIAEKYADASEEQKAKVENYLLENALSSAYLLVNMNKAHQAAGLKIYDEGLEIAYKQTYDTNFTNASITDYTAFETTTEENSSVVAKLTYNNKEYTLTAQALFDRLVEHYGTALSLLYIQEYTILSNEKYNAILDYATGTIKDQAKYDSFYATDVTKYKTALEAGEYATKGFPTNYGWENFLRDYLGVLSEKDIMTTYGGSLYEAAEALYIKDIYTSEVEYEKDAEGNQVLDEDNKPIVIKTADQAIQDEMQKIFDEFFSATMVGVYAYFDADLNGVADEMNNEQQAQAKELVNKVYAEAKNSEHKSITEGLTTLVNEYKLTSVLSTDTSPWKSYKALGLRLALVSSTTYTNSSSAAEEILANAKTQWDLVYNYQGEDTTRPNPMAQTLDPGYRSVINSKVSYITSATFADQADSFIANNSAYRLVITKATDHSYISTYYKTFKPTLAEYENYLLADTDENKTTVSTSLKTAITTYYVPAINRLASTTIVNNLIFTDCKANIDNNNVVISNQALKEKALALIDYSLNK